MWFLNEDLSLEFDKQEDEGNNFWESLIGQLQKDKYS